MAVKPSPPSPRSKPIPTPETPMTACAPLATLPPPKAPQTVQVTFAFLEPQAREVSVSGVFNGWATQGVPLSRKSNGLWETSLALPPGRYEYKFVVDGEWLPDPNAHENVFNEHGTLNSVVEVRA
jgi:1,4-alpha-glucan branching enzyme